MKSHKLFITGTDTDVGKTYVSTGILSACNRLGYSTLGVKPVASGCLIIDNQLCSPDTLALQAHSSIKLAHDIITPFVFEPPIAPHIAADQTGRPLSVENINLKLNYALNYPSDISVIEGCGGWDTPLNQTETMADFVVANSLKTILVIGIRLGCLNHSILTYRAMRQAGVQVIGWVGNCMSAEMLNVDDNIAALREWLPVPCIGIVERDGKVENAIDVNSIFAFY